jgi:hypothetical protein
MTKTAFVLSLPTLSTAEVVAKAKTQRIKISIGHVANIRSKAKHKNGKPKPSGKRIAGNAESRFAELAIELGLGRADRLLRNVRALARG